jgi:hypothetical protein
LDARRPQRRQRGNDEQQRSLQQDTTAPAPAPLTDNAICDRLLGLTYDSQYEKEQTPCSCARRGADSFTVACQYDYCPECIDNNTTCGVLSAEYLHLQEDPNTLPRPVYGNECITYTSGIVDVQTVCVRTSVAGNNLTTTTTAADLLLQLACDITVDEEQCASCDFVDCPAGSIETEDLLYDCTNVVLGAENLCNTSSTTTPTTTDPLVFLRSDVFTFETCSDPLLLTPAPTTRTPRPTASPLFQPVQQTLGNTKEAPTASAAAAVVKSLSMTGGFPMLLSITSWLY